MKLIRWLLKSKKDAKAVNDVVLYLIPSLLVLFGIIGAVAIVAFVYRFRPVVIEFYPRLANVDSESKNEAIQMEKFPKYYNLKD